MSSLADQGITQTESRQPGRARLDVAAAAILVLGLAYFVVLFFGWNALCLVRAGASVCLSEFGILSGWGGVGVVAGLLAVILLVWETSSAAGLLRLTGRATQPLVTAGLAAGVVVLTLVRTLTHLSGLTAFAWAGLALAGCACAVAIARWVQCSRSPG